MGDGIARYTFGFGIVTAQAVSTSDYAVAFAITMLSATCFFYAALRIGVKLRTYQLKHQNIDDVSGTERNCK